MNIPSISHRLTVLLLLSLAACGAGDDHASGPAYNVLLVTLDTTRPDHLSCYDPDRMTTPHMDRVAADGARFERAISTAGLTPMSHASILTGLNNYQHGMRVFFSEECSYQLKDSVDTLAEILARQGYRTAAHVSAYPVSEFFNLHQGFASFNTGLDPSSIDLTRQLRHATHWNPVRKTNSQRRADSTVDDVLVWLEDEATQGDPWCMWMHLFDVHDSSLIPPVEFLAELGFEPPPVDTVVPSNQRPAWREKIYDPELRWVDEQVGRVLDWLRVHDQYDNTIVVITADHGQGLLDGLQRHGWAKHRLLYDWSIRVPLIVKIPGRAGVVIEKAAQVRTIDILPTLLEVLDVPLRQAVEGRSLLAIIDGETPSEPRIAYADALNLYDAYSPKQKALPEGQYDNLYAVTDGRWKLIWHEARPPASQLFDLLHDPLELRNLYRPDHPEAVRFQAFLDERDVAKVEPPSAGGEGTDGDLLNQLGYGGDD